MFEKLHEITKWDNIFLHEATLWSRMSHDLQTKCGCVLVKDKTVLSTGYNGFMRDIDDTILPRTRPAKYPFMIHAEANAIYNSVRIGRCTDGATAYITAPPCTGCLQMLYQCGIEKIIFSDISQPKMCIYNEEYATILKMVEKKIEIRFAASERIDTTVLKEVIKQFDKKNKD
jgi:dCMP deaminase